MHTDYNVSFSGCAFTRPISPQDWWDGVRFMKRDIALYLSFRLVRA